MRFCRDVYIYMTYLINSFYCDKHVHKPKIVLEKMKSHPLGLKSTVDNNNKIERNKLEMRSGYHLLVVFL